MNLIEPMLYFEDFEVNTDLKCQLIHLLAMGFFKLETLNCVHPIQFMGPLSHSSILISVSVQLFVAY